MVLLWWLWFCAYGSVVVVLLFWSSDSEYYEIFRSYVDAGRRILTALALALVGCSR